VALVADAYEVVRRWPAGSRSGCTCDARDLEGASATPGAVADILTRSMGAGRDDVREALVALAGKARA
jgi:hypothetical protein